MSGPTCPNWRRRPGCLLSSQSCITSCQMVDHKKEVSKVFLRRRGIFAAPVAGGAWTVNALGSRLRLEKYRLTRIGSYRDREYVLVVAAVRSTHRHVARKRD